MAAASEAFQLEPHERFMLLASALEEVPPERAADVLSVSMSAACIVLRQVLGKVDKASAYAAVDRARVAVSLARSP